MRNNLQLFKIGLALMLTICSLQMNAQTLPGTLVSSWFGNSNADMNTFVPQGIEDIFVATDGTVYSNVHWEEGGGQITVVKDGIVSHAKGNHGWGHLGGSAITANAT